MLLHGLSYLNDMKFVMLMECIDPLGAAGEVTEASVSSRFLPMLNNGTHYC